MLKISALVLSATALIACANPVTSPPPAPEVVRVVETQIVEVPVAVSRRPPADLLVPFQPTDDDLPAFVLPAAQNASSCLTPEGETKLIRLLLKQRARELAWRAWAQETPE